MAQEVLREKLGFGGVGSAMIFSAWKGQRSGRMVGRADGGARGRLRHGVVINNLTGADELLASLNYTMPAVSLARLARLHGKLRAGGMVKLREDANYARALHAIAGIGHRNGDLPLST